jgi:hypothetical protein
MREFRQIGSGRRMFAVLLLTAALLPGCGGKELQVLEGSAFVRAPDPVAGGARVYLYWPGGAAGPWEQVYLYGGPGIQVLRQGGYVETIVPPGPHHFSASQNWTLNATNLVGVELGEVEMEAESNRTYFVRVQPKPRGWPLEFELSPIEPEASALPEIQKCRRTFLGPVVAGQPSSS